MSKKIITALLAVILMLCGCERNEPDGETAETTREETSDTSVTSASETETESVPITFAKAETEIIVTETEETELPKVLADNQLEYSGRNVYILMEFTGAEPLSYYPHAVKLSNYNKNDYVLHANFQVTNLSKKSIDFIPQNILIRGSNKDERDTMVPITDGDSGLTAADKYYTVEPQDTVSFDVDFVGGKVCVMYADEIVYGNDLRRDKNDIDATKLKNVAAGKFSLTKRTEIKNAVIAALEISMQENADPAVLAPKTGEYSVLSPKNSYCFTAEPIDGGNYVRVALRLQSLTGEPETFEPQKFRLDRIGGHDAARIWSFDTSLAGTVPDVCDAKIDGVSETLYNSPFELSVRPDGSAEYTMYFFTANYDLSDYYMFSYDGKNDVFEHIIRLE